MNKKAGKFILSGAFMVLLCGSAFSAPRLTLPESVFDFGFTPQNSTVSHKFWLISSGEDSLLILKIIPG